MIENDVDISLKYFYAYVCRHVHEECVENLDFPHNVANIYIYE